MPETDADIKQGSKAPAFQFYARDFAQGTLSLSAEEVGVYIRLLCQQWDKGTLPSEIDRLARIGGVPIVRMRRIWPNLALYFVADPQTPGGLLNARLEAEREKQAKYRQLQADKGKASGASRRDRPTRTEPESNRGSTAVPSGFEPDGQPEPNSSPCSLHSADFRQSATRSPRAVQGGGLMAGTLPRDHLNCHHPCVRVCVSQKQHAFLVARHGGGDAALDAFYADVRRTLSPDVPIGDTPWKFWDAQFAAKFGSVVPGANGKTAGNMGNLQRFAARGKA